VSGPEQMIADALREIADQAGPPGPGGTPPVGVADPVPLAPHQVRRARAPAVMPTIAVLAGTRPKRTKPDER